MPQSDERTIEVTIEELKKTVARHDALERLQMNPDFQLLIEHDYFEKEPVRLSSLVAAPNAAHNARIQENCIDSFKAVGHLRAYLNGVVQQGETAKSQIEQNEAELEDLRSGVVYEDDDE